MGALPDQQAANLQMIGQFQSLLQSNSDALGRLQQEKTLLESMSDSSNKKSAAFSGTCPSSGCSEFKEV